jgi:hypothetical protein
MFSILYLIFAIFTVATKLFISVFNSSISGINTHQGSSKAVSIEGLQVFKGFSDSDKRDRQRTLASQGNDDTATGSTIEFGYTYAGRPHGIPKRRHLG